MKLFVLLFFSSFLYAQKPADKPAPLESSPQGETAPPSAVPPKQDPAPQQDSVPPPDPAPQQNPAPRQNQAPQKLPPNSEKQIRGNKESSSAQPLQPPQAVSVPPQPLSAPSEEPIPYYNPLHPQSSSAYQEGDLPGEGFSNMTAPRNRKHRFSAGGRLLDYSIQGDKKRINLNVLADYGYSRKYFETGPYAAVEVSDFEFGIDSLQDALMLDAGAFFEVNFADSTSQKNTPSIGLKAGYKRKENTNYLAGQMYVSMKFFLNHQTAFFISLAPYLQYKWQGQKWEWGVEIPAGLRFYFY